MLAVTALGLVLLAGPGDRSASAAPPGAQRTIHSVLPVAAGAVAEATAAIDPHDARRMAVAADPYLAPTRIQVSTSADGGAHWAAATDVLPPGMVKSYDPQLAFAADGSMLVVGGASPDRRNGCQERSEIFLATIRGRHVRYLVAAAAPTGGLLDRPTFVLDAAARRVVVAWTYSAGPGAACQLRPRSSTTQVVHLTTGGPVSTVTTLPRIATAPFGSSLAVSGEGTFGLVVAGRAAGAAQTIAVYHSRDAVHWQPTAVGGGQAPPDSLPGLGGPVLAMPTITGLPAGFAVAWTDASSGTPRTRLAVSRANAWTEVPAPAASTATLVPTIGADGEQLVLEQAARTPSGLRFDTWQRTGRNWEIVASDGSGPIADRHELGEALGLAEGPSGARVSAVPVDRAGASALLVRTLLPPPPVRPAGVAVRPQSPGGVPVWLVVLAVGAGAVALLGLGRLRAARRRQ